MKAVPLGELASVNPRNHNVQPETQVSFVGMAELNASSATANSQSSRTFGEVSKGYTIFQDKDILVAKITPCWENGKIGQARLDHPIGVGSTEFHVVRPNEQLDHRYLLHFLRQDFIRTAGESRMTGSAGQKRIPTNFLEKLRVPLIPMAEQRRIAAILDHSDAVRTKQRELAKHLNSLVGSAFHCLIGPDAKTIKLGDAGTSFHYGTSTKSGPEGYPTLRIPNVIGGKLDLKEVKTVPAETGEFERLQLRDGDVLFVRSNGNIENVGRSAIFDRAELEGHEYDPDRWIYASYLIRARIEGDIKPEIVTTYLDTPEGRTQLRNRAQTSAGQFNINTAGLSTLTIPNPPRSVQERFKELRRKILQLAEKSVLSLSHHDQLFATLQSRAFRGEL